MGMKQKIFFFFEKKNSKWPTQKNDVLVQIYMVEWMGRNFDVFPGFQKIP